MKSELGMNLYQGIYSPVRLFEVKLRGEKPFTVEASRIMRSIKDGVTGLEKGMSVYVFEAKNEDILYIRDLTGVEDGGHA